MAVQGPIPEIDVEGLAPLLDSGIVLVDVRMPDEYDESHVAGAQLIPLPELTERHGEIPDADTVYVICKVGGRSMKACEFLAANGRDVVNVSGGTLAWIESGRPVLSGPERG